MIISLETLPCVVFLFTSKIKINKNLFLFNIIYISASYINYISEKLH